MSDQIEAFKGFYYELRSIVDKKPDTGSNEVETRTLRNLVGGLEMGDNQVVANVLAQLDEILEDIKRGPYLIQAKTLLLLASQIMPLLEEGETFKIV